MPKTYSQEYAITLTGTKLTKQYDHMTQHRLMIMEAKDLSTGKVQMSLRIEMTVNADIHYHGMAKIQMDDGKRSSGKTRLINHFRRKKYIGFVCVKPITDERKWDAYCMKDVEATEAEGLESIALDQLHKWTIIDQLPLNSPKARVYERPLSPQEYLNDLDNN